MSSSYYFSIIGTRDNPLYEVEFSSFKNPPTSSTASASLTAATIPSVQSPTGSLIVGRSQFPSNIKEILPFISNSSLDLIEDVQWSTKQFYLGKVDSFYGLYVNAFITQGNVKFILCYDFNNSAVSPSVPNGSPSGSSSTLQKYEENSIKQFFFEVNDLYVKCLMNPFYSVNDAIVSPDFDLKVKLLARRYL